MPDEIDAEITKLVDGGGQGIVISSDPALKGRRTSIVATAHRCRLVTVCDELEWASADCLITYGEDPYIRPRRAAGRAAKILKGARPVLTE